MKKNKDGSIDIPVKNNAISDSTHSLFPRLVKNRKFRSTGSLVDDDTPPCYARERENIDETLEERISCIKESKYDFNAMRKDVAKLLHAKEPVQKEPVQKEPVQEELVQEEPLQEEYGEVFRWSPT